MAKRTYPEICEKLKASFREIPCILCEGPMEFRKQTAKNKYEIICPRCLKKDGITNKLVLTVVPKKKGPATR